LRNELQGVRHSAGAKKKKTIPGVKAPG